MFLKHCRFGDAVEKEKTFKSLLMWDYDFNQSGRKILLSTFVFESWLENRLSDRIGSPLQKLQHFWSLNLLMLLDKILPPSSTE